MIERVKTGDEITYLTETNSAGFLRLYVTETHMFVDTAAFSAQGIWLHYDQEGVVWARGWEGPAVDALFAARALR